MSTPIINAQMLFNARAHKDLLDREDRGSDTWWKTIEKIGTPLQELMGDDIELTFLWRDPDGCQSNYARVYIDVYSHTPHPTSSQTSMERVENTDIWFWKTRLPSDWCGSYFLMPAKQHQLPPDHADRRTLRRWWINLMRTNAQADQFNLQPTHNSGWGLSLSSIQLRDANVHWAWWSSQEYLKGSLQQQLWQSQRLANERVVWVYRTSKDASDNLPLVILLDGHYWAQHMPIFAPLDELTSRGELPPATYVLIDALNPEARSNELPCNENFWLAVQEELFPQLNISNIDPQRTLIAGQSFGGLSALYAALHWPEKFGAVLSQSGSFWWPDSDETGNQGELTQAVIAGLAKNKNLRVLLEVGCYETDMIGVNRAMYDALLEQNINVTFQEFRGGHDWNCWRHGLLRGLSQLLKATN